MTTGIYKITNLVNGKVYIGASKRIEARFWEHKRGYTAIAEDLKTFGLENFKFEVLLECPEDMLCQWERDMICLYDADDPEKGYNDKDAKPYSLKASEVLKGRPGTSHSDETRRKISKSLKGHKTSDETKHKMSEANKGQKAWNKGIPRSEETKRKISETLKGKPAWNKGLKSNKPAWNKGLKMTKQKETNIC